MKARALFAGIILIFALIAFLGSCATTENAISGEDAMNALCHTWTNPGGNGTDKDIYKHDGTYEWYYSVESSKPNYTGEFKIEKAWSDAEGTIWIIAKRTYANSRALYKISNSGTVIEIVPFYGDDPPNMEGKTFPYIYYRQ